MKQITLAIIFVALMLGTSFALDCPKCKVEMTEKEDKYICPKCGSIVPITRTNIYPKPTVVEKKTETTNEEWEKKRKKLDENLIKDIKKIGEESEYDSKIKRIEELKNRIERLEGELRIVEDEMKKIDWERNMSTGRLPYNLGYRYAGLKGRKEGIQESIRRYEFEIETIKRSL